MGKILCPTRGGEGSYRTQDAAIAMAKQGGDELVFLYVVDLDFLNRTERAVRPDVVAEEMRHLGEFLLSMAQERAHHQGVEARYVLREGDVPAEIKAAALEEQATMVVLGQAKCIKPGSSVGPDQVARVVARLRRGWLGIFITTGVFSDQAQVEIVADQYPIVLVPALKLVDAVTQIAAADHDGDVSAFLDSVLDEYENAVTYRRPEEILSE